MGSSTCYQLAKRGMRVLGLEQFNTPHEWGSHAGDTRIIRKAYFEHPDYIPLLIRSYENFKEISERSGKQLYHQTGLFYAAPQGHELLENIKHAAALYGIPLMPGPHPAFTLPEGFEGLFEPEAGFVEPENTIRAFVSEARKLGADIHEGERLLNWKINDGLVNVYTNKAEYGCKKLVITAGAWSAKTIPGIQEKLKVTRQVLVWVKPSQPEQFSETRFPCWVINNGSSSGSYYGFPIIPERPGALKIAHHWPDLQTDPDQVDRVVHARDTDHLIQFIGQCIPSVHISDPEAMETKVCLYSNSPDEHFVIDNLPGMEAYVSVAWGFSGHGFKFAPVVGEVLADLAMYHKTELPIGFLNAGRFS